MKSHSGAVIAFVLVGLSLATPAAAQRGSNSINALDARWHSQFSAGRYADALETAQQFVRATGGVPSYNYGLGLLFVAQSLQLLERYSEADTYYKQVLNVLGSLQPVNRNFIIKIRTDVGLMYTNQGRLAEAESYLRETLAMVEQTAGYPPKDLANLLNNLGMVYNSQNRYKDAEPIHRRALAMSEQASGAVSEAVANSAHNLGVALYSLDRVAEAEPLFRRAVAIRERIPNANRANLANTLVMLGVLKYEVEGANQEAIGLYERAAAIQQQALGPEAFDLATTLDNLALVYQDDERFDEAEKRELRALAIREKVLGADHSDTARSLNNLGMIYVGQNRFEDAERVYKRSLAVWEKALGPDAVDIAIPLQHLGYLYKKQNRYTEAEQTYQRALTIRMKALGPKNQFVASSLLDLALIARARDDSAGALAYSRKATESLLGGLEIGSSGVQQRVNAHLVSNNGTFFRRHVASLAEAARKGIEPDVNAGREAFAIAQWTDQSAAAAALAQLGVRIAAGDGALAALVRESQDLSASWNEKEKALAAARSSNQDRGTTDRLQKDMAAVETRLAAIASQLRQSFPDYIALSDPKPLKTGEAQALLGPDEALVYFLLGDDESYVFALTRDRFDWRVIPLGNKAMTEKVAVFRRGLDVDMVEDEDVLAAVNKKRELFDVGVANELYVALIGPVEALVKDKGHLMVVPAGALTAIPFHLLVTAPPITKPESGNFTAYRDADWLIKRQAVSVLPSIGSLKAVRAFARKNRGSKPMIGFGDPMFNPAEAAAGSQRGARSSARAITTRSFTDFWQGVGVDRAKLSQALPRLADTADELRAVAAKLGSVAGDVLLRRDASETNVKRLPLGDYRIVYFATHGLVAGDVKGLGEPSLVLTIPARPSAIDDGLLTASEITQLKLNADWVVLSACNTIAGDKPGAEALSGLARAFFYAGAGALLVSHWAVESNAATRLTTSTFDILQSDLTIGRAEALRRAMLAYLNDQDQPRNAYPALWAPFEVVGEGGTSGPP